MYQINFIFYFLEYIYTNINLINTTIGMNTVFFSLEYNLNCGHNIEEWTTVRGKNDYDKLIFFIPVLLNTHNMLIDIVFY